MSDVSVERLELLLRGDAPRDPAEARRAAVLDGLRAGTLQAPPALRARVLAAGPAPRSPRRRLAFALVPAAVAAAVVAAVVHGVSSSGTGPTPVPVASPPAPAPFERAAPQSSAGNAGAGAAAAPKHALATPSIADNGTRLQHTDASLEIQVADADHVSAATSQATRIATSLGGYAQSVHYDSGAGGGSAELDLRVPAQNVRTAIARLSALGTVVSQSLSEQDLQALFTAQTNRIAELRRRVAALSKAVASPSLPDAQRVLLQLQLSEARRSLSQSLNARKGTVAQAADANVSVMLETKPRASAVPPHRGRLGRMIHSAAGFLGIEGTIVLYALVVLSPLLVIAAAAWWIARLRRRREERRLLAA